MLSTDEIANHLQRLSYKPGWTFYVYDHRWEGQVIVIETEIEDTFHPGETVKLVVRSPIHPLANTEELERWLMWRLGRIENHEMREFFKRDGKVVSDPHAEDAIEEHF